MNTKQLLALGFNKLDKHNYEMLVKTNIGSHVLVNVLKADDGFDKSDGIDPKLWLVSSNWDCMEDAYTVKDVENLIAEYKDSYPKDEDFLEEFIYSKDGRHINRETGKVDIRWEHRKALA